MFLPIGDQPDTDQLGLKRADPSLPMVVQDRHPSSGVWLTITGPPPVFFVSVASKGVRVSVTSLFSTLARGLVSGDSKGV